jgi:hypothetical protein
MNDEERKRAELAWAAGFFDGEGCTYLKKGRKSYSPALGITQNDPEVLHRFQKAVGAGAVNGPYDYRGRGYKTNIFWRYSAGNISEIMEQLWPWLSTPKKKQYMEKIGRG